MHIWAVIVAAGQGTRLASAGFSAPKQFIPLGDRPLFLHSAKTFSSIAPLQGIIFVMPPVWHDSYLQYSYSTISSQETGTLIGAEAIAAYEAYLRKATAHLGFDLPFKVVLGGERRQDSVYNALAALPSACDSVLIHDAARPFVSSALIMRVIEGLQAEHVAVIPGVEVTDTIKAVNLPATISVSDADKIPLVKEQEYVCSTYPRETLRAIQTPQGFLLAELVQTHAYAKSEGLEATDDAALMERMGYPVVVVKGEERNRKITTPEDFAWAEQEVEKMSSNSPTRIPCTGFGYDVHRYGGERPFILGGVPIPCSVTVAAHSDGDTLLHALIDALLGCICAGDIGALFPDTDAAYENISSGVMLAEVLERCALAELEIMHVDITIVAQVPRIAPFRSNIADNIAKLLHLPLNRVNIKATTEEKLGFTGEKKGIKVVAVVTGIRVG